MRRDYCEYNVDDDPEAYARMQSLTNGGGAVPVLVEDDRVIQIGWQGRSCFLGESAIAVPQSEPLRGTKR